MLGRSGELILQEALSSDSEACSSSLRKMLLVSGVFHSPYGIASARIEAEWVSGHVFCLSLELKQRWNRYGGEA